MAIAAASGFFGTLLLWVWPLAKKVLESLGIGWLTYEALSALSTQLNAEVLANWGQLPASMVQIATLLGMPQALGIILGAISARIVLASAARMGKLTA